MISSIMMPLMYFSKKKSNRLHILYLFLASKNLRKEEETPF